MRSSCGQRRPDRAIQLDDPASERRRTAARRAAPTLVAVCTWLLAWGGLGHATSAADCAIAATGAVVWAFALAAARR